jgi:cephalosporin-C deacetylase-like acetyl esterase
MFLGNIRAADYITARPDWDGKTLVATGGSQGGYQSVVLAGLDSRVTAVIANVPAGCDITARSAGRAGGWPSWWLPTEAANRAAIIETSRYYDTVNFASRVRVPTLIGMGLIDTTCPPSGIFAMINQLNGPKETVVMPLEGHQGRHSSYENRASDWLKALAVGGAAPVKP